MAKFITKLTCDVERIEYDYATETGCIYVPEGNTTDMHRCIEFFKKIDPHVCDIKTFVDGKESILYVRENQQSEWRKVQTGNREA